MSDQFYTPSDQNNVLQDENVEKIHLLKSLGNMVVSPKDVLKLMPDNGGSFWLPALLIAGFMFAFLSVYFSYTLPVDMLSYLFQMEPELEQSVSFEQMLQNYWLIKPSMIILPVLIMGMIFFFSSFVLYVASNLVCYKQYSFLTWLGFNAWVFLPAIFISLVQILSFINLGGMHQFVSLTDLEVLSLNSLFFQLEANERFYTLASTFNPFYIWSIGLSVYGFKLLTKCHWLQSIVVNIIVISASIVILSLIAG